MAFRLSALGVPSAEHTQPMNLPDPGPSPCLTFTKCLLQSRFPGSLRRPPSLFYRASLLPHVCNEGSPPAIRTLGTVRGGMCSDPLGLEKAGNRSGLAEGRRFIEKSPRGEGRVARASTLSGLPPVSPLRPELTWQPPRLPDSPPGHLLPNKVQCGHL